MRKRKDGKLLEHGKQGVGGNVLIAHGGEVRRRTPYTGSDGAHMGMARTVAA